MHVCNGVRGLKRRERGQMLKAKGAIIQIDKSAAPDTYTRRHVLG
jgi:hypothetical protein